jgi:hypothetical protein
MDSADAYKPVALNGFRFVAHFLAMGLVGLSSNSATAIPSFTSVDWRLPNPDRPYEMTSGTVDYGASLFALYDLKFQVANPTQLDTPSLRSDGRLEFDSTFDITYQAVISRGLEPPHPVTGIGTARAVGITRPDTTPFDSIYYLQVFDTELISLNLYALSPIPEVMFRESPTLRSSGSRYAKINARYARHHSTVLTRIIGDSSACSTAVIESRSSIDVASIYPELTYVIQCRPQSLQRF